MEAALQHQPETQRQQLAELLRSGRLQPIRRMLHALHPAEIAHLLESLPPTERKLIWSLVESEVRGDVLVLLAQSVRADLTGDMQADDFRAAAEYMDTDDLADLIQELPDRVTQQILTAMSEQDRERLESVLAYGEDTAGGLMNTDTVTVRADVTLDVVFRYLRLRGELPDHTDSLFVVNRYEKFLGTLPLAILLTSDPDKTVAEVMPSEIVSIPVDTPATDVAQLFEIHDLISAAVIDSDGKLLGRITIDDIVDLIRDEAEHNLLSHAGLNEEDDVFAPVWKSTRRRALWLGINLLTALLAAWVIGNFQATLERVVALAVLMPIVASMGGIAGTQTLTLMIRGIALDQIGAENTRWLLYKEISVGLLNGIIWSAIVAGITILWFGNLQIGGIIAAALIINLICASLAGVAIPIALQKLSIDPALAGGVILTTITDVIGFLTFLGLATLLLR
ncbi:MAG TPA: magnesium transporter [Gammaproteobacteria bacterium]|nr:magnesium transporter [Gammaproteobacteria bacterium]